MKHPRALLITLLIFVLLGVTWVGYWWFYGRFYAYTDDAYVDGNQISVTPRIPGTVISFSAIDGDLVSEGRLLVELDPQDANLALERASADLGEALREVTSLFEQAKRDVALVEGRKAEFIKAAQDYEHRKGLVVEGGVSLEDFEHAQAALSKSFFDLYAAEHQALASLAEIENTTPTTHPLVESSKSRVKDAFLFLERCHIRAPVTGIVAQRSVEVGEQIKIGQPLMAIVPLNQLWVTANFKETQLKNMRIGQSVAITSDTYGRDVPFHGHLAGIGGGTGSVFSVLPPQNATGNWIKIVQRVPVRIVLDQELVRRYPLRLGLSVEASVDTHDTSMPYTPSIKEEKPLFSTPIFETQEDGAEGLIEKIILENTPHA